MKTLLIQPHGGFQPPQQQSQQLNLVPPPEYEEATADSNESSVNINPFYSSPEAMLSFWAIRTEGLWSADVLGRPQAATLGDALGSKESQGCLTVSGDRSEGPSSVEAEASPSNII
ncbi:mCG1045252 [Mus musculus]|nr:mCG1045252 [Mus musculus]